MPKIKNKVFFLTLPKKKTKYVNYYGNPQKLRP